MNPTPANPVLFPTGLHRWLASWQGRFWLLAVVVGLSVPAIFSERPDMGLDASWHLSLQVAAIKGTVFGREFVFTYGPLGYLLLHAPVNKAAQLGYDLFVLGSLLAIYRSLWPARPALRDVFLLVALAVVTKVCWSIGPAAVLFTILCHWLWQIYFRGDALAVAGSLIAAWLLFLGKVNYGLIMVFLIPAYGIGLLLLHGKRRIQGIVLLAGFLILVGLGAMVWHVDLPNYLHSGIELIAGYNEAMYASSPDTYVALVLASLFLVGMGIVAVLGCRKFSWREQAMLLPLIGLAVLLLFKNGFVRADGGHCPSFCAALPLLLAVWCIGWRGVVAVRVLLFASTIYSITLLALQPGILDRSELVPSLPLRYCRQLISAPDRENVSHLRDSLLARYPQSALPAGVRSLIGRSSVDVMPWESSLAVLNDLNYQPRPVPQSYSVYTSWLDHLNASFLGSTNAPDYILYAYAQMVTIDGRPAAWDESLAKMALLENYSFDSEFSLPMRVWPHQKTEPAQVFLLRHTPHVRRLLPIATNEVTLDLGQPLAIPATTNLLFLTLDVNRSGLGKLAASALSPVMLIACFQYQDGSRAYDRAILPILKSGVLINRRVESADETRNWLETAATRNMAVTSVGFTTFNAWAFRSPFKGSLVEYRLVEGD